MAAIACEPCRDGAEGAAGRLDTVRTGHRLRGRRTRGKVVLTSRDAERSDIRVQRVGSYTIYASAASAVRRRTARTSAR